MRASGSPLRRFVSPDIDVSRSTGLKPDHPAVVEGRTIFTSTVVSPLDSPRLLVSGVNNPKLGKMITKGPRKGWPIFQLTLEERATCPRSCEQFGDCYGNAMHRARRHRADEHLMPLLAAELAIKAASHPNGFLVRLHTLGDFFSTGYVSWWSEQLDLHPALHVFGYTHRQDEIGVEVQKLATNRWDRFAIRLSHSEAGPQRSIVVDKDPGLRDVVICPAQTKGSECCGTCGLCWQEGARHLTVAFMRHGMKRRAASTGADHG